ncbi:MAG: hypothetical protein QM669_10425 [Siphonobacter sp.]
MSILGFLVALLMAYQQLPDFVTVDTDFSDVATKNYHKEVVFYVVAGLMLVANVLFVWIARLFPKLPDGFIKLPGAVKWMSYRKQLNDIITEWMNFGAIVVNFMLGLSIYVLAILNAPETSKAIPYFRWVFGAAALLVFIWIIYMPLRLLLSGPVKDE